MTIEDGCPYCPSNNFTPEETELRSGSVNDNTAIWINKCSGCNNYSVFKDSDGLQYSLVNKSNKNSEIID